MIDPTSLPILLKAVDFIFDEGRKILDERRERRKAQDPAAEPTAAKPENEVSQEPAKVLAETKQELLSSKIDEMQWKNHEAEVGHLVRLLDTYSGNYRLAKEQYSKWGSALVPPIIVHNLTEAENAVIDTTAKLETLLARIYKKETPSAK